MMFWWPLAAAILHIVEEFVFPGGFTTWDHNYRRAFGTSIAPSFHLSINGLLILACSAVGLMGQTPRGVAGWLALSALLVFNAVFHLIGAIQTRRYSPGMVTGLLLYVPMGLYGYTHFLRSHQASVGRALAALAIGASYHCWSATVLARSARGMNA